MYGIGIKKFRDWMYGIEQKIHELNVWIWEKNPKIGCMESELKVHELNIWNLKKNNLEMGCMELNQKNL
jgi:hypothetical protein